MFIIKKYLPWFIFFGLGLLLLSGCNNSSTTAASGSPTIKVVAAENFYGDIASQLGGSHVMVTSILSDPNVDPHEYESNVQNAMAVSDAQLVIENSGGYDSWMDKLLSSSNTNRHVIKAFDLAPHKLPANAHVWYSMINILAIAQSIASALKQSDAKDATTFDRNLTTFRQSIQAIQQKIETIKAKYAGTSVGLTETIFLYQTELLGLKVLTPFEFQKAIAEGNDPPADTVATVNNQVSRKEVKVLIYNEQTITAITTNVQNSARQQHIPVVPVTETMPPGKTYQSWMLGQLDTLQQALGG